MVILHGCLVVVPQRLGTKNNLLGRPIGESCGYRPSVNQREIMLPNIFRAIRGVILPKIFCHEMGQS